MEPNSSSQQTFFLLQQLLQHQQQSLEDVVSTASDDHNITLMSSNETSELDVREFYDEELVEEIRKYSCIWDTKCRAYKDSIKKQKAWSELAILFGKEGT